MTKVTPAFLARATVESKQGKKLLWLTPSAPTRCKCANCADMRTLQMQICKGGYQSPPTTKSAITYDSGLWYIVEETIVCACPVCCDRETLMQSYLHGSGIPEHEWNWTIDYIAGQQGKVSAHKAAVDLLALTPSPTGLYLFWGSYGQGKSGLIKALVVQFCKAAVVAHYVRAADILSELRSSFRDGCEYTEQDIAKLYDTYPVLAVDEVSEIADTPYALSALRTILDKRYENRQRFCTLLASNENPDDLWPYLASRCEDGQRIRLAGESLRGKEQ